MALDLAKLRELAMSATGEIRGDDDGSECAACHSMVSTDEGCEATALCHHCAQEIANSLGSGVLALLDRLEAAETTLYVANHYFAGNATEEQLYESLKDWRVRARDGEREEQRPMLMTPYEYRERINELRAEVKRQRERIEELERGLTEISEALPCDEPCAPPNRVECQTCHYTHGPSWCAGCVARAALKSKSREDT